MGWYSRKPDRCMQTIKVHIRLQSDRQLYYLLSVAEQASLSLTWSETPEDLGVQWLSA